MSQIEQIEQIEQTYWPNQPLEVTINNKEDNISFLDYTPMTYDHKKLPTEFTFKTLSLQYLDEIHSLLLNHYIEDDDHIVRISYSRDFLYWYLKKIEPGLIIGLIYSNKLVGLITALSLDMILYGQKTKLAYVNLLCINSKLRDFGLAPTMIDEIKVRIYEKGTRCALFSGVKAVSTPFVSTKMYSIPINYNRLKKVNFLFDDIPPLPELEQNDLHLMVASNLESVIPNLNNALNEYDIRPEFGDESAHHFLLPKKNIVYSFVKRDSEGNCTDFISLYKYYFYCLDKDTMISTGIITFYYHQTIGLPELVTLLLDKLKFHHFDQLNFYDTMNNDKINLTRYSTHGELHYFFYNLALPKTDPKKICLFPI